ncbi:hypothetical protein, partial [Escherichia coli]|uniref:hypothetical protein n=1 Tax=Escherichia coli TaxID=562 RepID=UPI00200DB8B5
WSTSKTPSYTKSVSWQHHLDFDDVNFYRNNPATGLAMYGGFDSAGNTFGTCWQDYDDRR